MKRIIYILWLIFVDNVDDADANDAITNEKNIICAQVQRRVIELFMFYGLLLYSFHDWECSHVIKIQRILCYDLLL